MHLKAHVLLKENIDALLKTRGMTRKDLAQWCRNSESWISKIFRKVDKQMPAQYLDRIADALGLEVYQLYQPGISKRAERRTNIDRRSGQERRIGHTGRQLAMLRAEVDKVPSLASHDHAAVSPSARRLHALLTEAARISAELGQQTAALGVAVAGSAQRRRGVRGPHARKA